MWISVPWTGSVDGISERICALKFPASASGSPRVSVLTFVILKGKAVLFGHALSVIPHSHPEVTSLSTESLSYTCINHVQTSPSLKKKRTRRKKRKGKTPLPLPQILMWRLPHV